MSDSKTIYIYGDEPVDYCKVRDDRCRPIGCPLFDVNKEPVCRYLIHKEEMKREK